MQVGKIHAFWSTFLGALLLFSAPSLAQEISEEEDHGHKTGTAGYGDYVAADYRVPAGSPGAQVGAVPDAAGRVPHICAGKKLLHHSHVDAAYVTKLQGKITTTVVDGQSVVENPASVCVRLAPDARQSDGVEVSRWVIPGKKDFSFLGKAGDIIWRAPQEQIDNWRPVWAGIGAFDTAHEVQMPAEIKNGDLQLSLVKKSGPGEVEVWRTVGQKEITRGISSKHSLTPLKLKIGAHGHWNWTFSKAGIYNLQFQASYEDSQMGGQATSEASTITWLVGTDTEVGLPPNTTSALNPIKTTAEQLRTQMEKTGELTTEPQVDNAANSPLTPAAARTQILEIVHEPWIPKPTNPNHYVFRSYFTDDKRDDGSPFKRVAATLEDKDGKTSAAPVLEIPDSLQQETAEGKKWILGNNRAHSQLDFDFRKLEKKLRSEAISFNISVFNAPAAGRYVVEKQDGNSEKILDSASRPEEQYDEAGTFYHLTHSFNRPGFYEVSFDVQTIDTTGKFSYKYQTVYFAVGDATIKELRNLTGQGAYQPLPTDTDTSSQKQTPNKPLVPQKLQYLITEGHMDQALAYKDGKAQSFVEDTSDPRKPRQHLSGTFSYAVPDSTHSIIPADARGYGEIRTAAPHGVWVLPEAQLSGVPWVGFSTLRVDYTQLKSPGVTIRITDFSGPGRLITGNDSLITGGFAKRLDSADPNLHLQYSQATHDHQAMYFTAPGRYELTFLYVLHLKDGTTKEVPLRAVFLVGDKEISQAKQGKNHREQPLSIEELLRRLNKTTEKSGADSAADTELAADTKVEMEILESLQPNLPAEAVTTTEEKTTLESPDNSRPLVSALLNPDNGAKGIVTPLWQWILLGSGIIAFTAASSWAIWSRLRIKKQGNN